MNKQQLGNSDFQITSVGVGAWAMGGGGWEFAWGPQNDDDSVAAIHAALDAGINWIDTAAVYGLGHSEEVVARALQGRAIRPYVFTKCSMVWDKAGPSLVAEGGALLVVRSGCALNCATNVPLLDLLRDTLIS